MSFSDKSQPIYKEVLIRTDKQINDVWFNLWDTFKLNIVEVFSTVRNNSGFKIHLNYYKFCVSVLEWIYRFDINISVIDESQNSLIGATLILHTASRPMQKYIPAIAISYQTMLGTTAFYWLYAIGPTPCKLVHNFTC